MYMALSPGAVGVRAANLKEAIDVAAAAGFQGVEVGIHEVAQLVDEQGVNTVKAMFTDAGIRPAGWGLPVAWSGEEAKWKADLEALPRLAKAGQAIGCDRVSTWILPGHNDRPMAENRRFHVERFKPAAAILAEHGCRLGLEFIGPKTLRDSFRHEFIYTMNDMLDMGAEIGPNVGLLLDCWHWYTAGNTVDELRRVPQERIVYVHVNDAPTGVPLQQHVDNKRCLPGATGVIDIAGFLRALDDIGYDGPVVPEPFGSPATWAADALRFIWRQAGLKAQG